MITISWGAMLGILTLIVTIATLVGPITFRLGGMMKQVDGHEKQLKSVWNKIEDIHKFVRREG